jgi:arginyl-tRNA--protein-N-Asp/Glu arginylyltransferase
VILRLLNKVSAILNIKISYLYIFYDKKLKTHSLSTSSLNKEVALTIYN